MKKRTLRIFIGCIRVFFFDSVVMCDNARPLGIVRAITNVRGKPFWNKVGMVWEEAIGNILRGFFS